MMARKLKIEELSVVADPWSLKLKPAKLTGIPFLLLGLIDSNSDRLKTA